MSYIFAFICTLLMLGGVLLLFMSLPGTWLILGVTALWAFFAGGTTFGWGFFLLLGGLAVFGEAAEFLIGHLGTKKYGGSNTGSIAGIVGAILGGILCAPVLFGLGALPGALAGGFAGCFAVELLQGKTAREAGRAAYGTTLGRLGGFLVKLGVAIAMLALALPAIWQSA